MPKGKSASYQEVQEELAYARQKCSSLSMRGHYVECVKAIEENLKFFYFQDRWPENLFGMLRLHQKCYPSLNKDQSHEEYLSEQLKKNGIPVVMTQMLRSPDSAISWTADYFRDKTLQCEKDGALDTALSYCDLLLKIDPGNSNAYLIKGRLLDASGKDGEALSMLERALEYNPSNRHALNGLAHHFMRSDRARAMGYVEQAIAQSPDDAANYALKADVLLAGDDYAGAHEALEEAIRLDPYKVDYPYRRGELYLEEDKQVNAIPQYRLALALDEGHIPSLMRLAEFAEEKQPEAALEYISAVTEKDPSHLQASLKKARLLHRLGDQIGSAAQYKRHLELDPACHEAMNALGSIYLHEKNNSAALGYLESACEIAPGNAAYRLNKARALRKLEQSLPAIEEYKKVTELDKKCAEAWGQLGFLTMERDPKGALDNLAKAIALEPERGDFYAARGKILMEMPGGNADAILQSFDLASRYDPGNPDYHIQLAKLLEEIDNIASATAHYRAALHLEPGNSDAHYRLSRLLMDTQPAQALYHITIAIQLSVIFGEYYYFKARMIDRIGEDTEALGQLSEAYSKLQTQDMIREQMELQSGGYLRIALMYLNRAIELSPDTPAYLCGRAYILYRMGQKGKALAQFEKLLKDNPNQHDALFGMARIHADKMDKKALDYFNRAIANAPSEADYHAEKAAFLVKLQEKYDEALKEFTAAIDLNKQAWPVVLQKARLLDFLNEWEGSCTEYRHVLLIHRTSLEASARMGQLLADISPAHALIYLDQAVRLDSENHEHYALRGKVHHALGKDEAGKADCDRAIELQGNTPEANFRQAELLYRASPAPALEYALRAAEEKPGDIEALLLLGHIYTALSQYSDARLYYRLAAELDQRKHETLESMAALTFLEGGKGALALVEEALASRPGCPDCLFLKAKILAAKKEYSSALDSIQQAVQLLPEHLEYRELFVDLLKKKKALLRLPAETIKLQRLRKRLEDASQLPEPPDFQQEEEPLPLPEGMVKTAVESDQ